MVDEQKRKLLELMKRALTEMEQRKGKPLREGRFYMQESEEYWYRYSDRMEELKGMYEYVHAGGSGKNAFRHIQMDIFGKNESFFMDLFDTRRFPWLFKLFEFVWRD